MKEEELDVLFRQKRNAEETVSLSEINGWLKAGAVAGAGISVVAASKWFLTKKFLFMTFGILTVAGIVTTATLYLAAGEKPVSPEKSMKLMSSPAVIRSVGADLDSEPAKTEKDTLKKTQNEPVSSLMPLVPLSPLSPLSPIEPITTMLPPLPRLHRLPGLLPDTTVQLESFDRIVGKGFLHFKIMQGEECKITMSGDADKWINWEVHNGKLTIEGNDDKNPKELIIYVKELKDFRLAGFCHAEIAAGVSMKELRLDLDGFSMCSLASPIDNLSVSVQGASKCTINSNVENADVVVSGMSTLAFSGKMGSVDIDLGGSSEIDMKGSAKVSHVSISGQCNLHAMDFEVKDLNIEATGESHAEVRAGDQLNAFASGLSTVIYSGEPRSISKKISGGSEIKAKS